MKFILRIIILFLFCNIQGQVLNKKGLKTYDGYFDFYYEESSDKIYLKVKKLEEEEEKERRC